MIKQKIIFTCDICQKQTEIEGDIWPDANRTAMLLLPTFPIGWQMTGYQLICDEHIVEIKNKEKEAEQKPVKQVL